MTLYTMFIGVLWYATFGRLQFAYATQQDLICILQANLASGAAALLAQTPSRIPATVCALICISTILTGLCSVVMGQLGVGSYMLLFPTPVINGFLGAIGVVVLRASMQTASGVQFQYFYPKSIDDFCAPGSLAQVGCMLGMVLCIRWGPSLLNRWSPKLERVSGLVCQLLPLVFFYIIVLAFGLSRKSLWHAGWTYYSKANGGPFELWRAYSLNEVDWPIVLQLLPDVAPIVLMAVMCTMLGVLAITDRFPIGPDGDPSPMETIDFDQELTTVGASSLLLGLTGGNVVFHKFSAIQLRLDGGTHRIAVVIIALCSGGLFVSGAPLGQIIPKFFLGGLFMNTGIHFLKNTLLSYKLLASFSWRGIQLPSLQYSIALVTVLTAVLSNPTTAILSGMGLSIVLFLYNSSTAFTVINALQGDHVVGRSKRPFWELRVLSNQGDRILLLYLQGPLFFGSVRSLVASLAAATAGDRVQFCILSFARVQKIDPSAARHLKTAADRAKLRGCEIICCRTNHEVFAALKAAEVVVEPDPDLLKHLQGLRWKTTPMISRPSKSLDPAKSPPIHFAASRDPFVAAFGSPDFRHRKSQMQPTVFSLDASTAELLQDPPSNIMRFDAFTHETDALDYCDDHIVSQYCYGSPSLEAPFQLEPYMVAYHNAVCAPGARLAEWAFEDMNNLPRGLLGRVREFCDVRLDVLAWTKLAHVSGALIFILQGSVSVIQMVPQVENLSVQADVQGFSFRQGKRLLKRYPPGHVAGINAFFLKCRGQVVDEELDPKFVISSKMGGQAEIWVLHPDAWAEVPMELKAPLTEMLCVQLADAEQHSR